MAEPGLKLTTVLFLKQTLPRKIEVGWILEEDAAVIKALSRVSKASTQALCGL